MLSPKPFIEAYMIFAQYYYFYDYFALIIYSSTKIIRLNTFGCIVVVAKEAVVDFPGVTLLLHL